MEIELNCGKRNRVDMSGNAHICRFTEANHIFVQGPVVINGVEHSYHVHLYRSHENKWITSSEFKKNNSYHDVYLSRCDHQEVSYNARSKAVEEIPILVREALQNLDQNTLQLYRTTAEKEHLSGRIGSATEKVKEKLEELHKEETNLQVLRKRLEDVENGTIPEIYKSE